MARAFGRAATLCGLALCCRAVPAVGQAISVETLQGSTIVATVNYDVRWRRGGEELSGPGSVTYRLTIGASGAYTGSVTRTQARGASSSTEQFSGTVGQAREAGGAISGHAVWMLSGNTLRMLRTYGAGGKTTVITFGAGGRSCAVLLRSCAKQARAAPYGGRPSAAAAASSRSPAPKRLRRVARSRAGSALVA